MVLSILVRLLAFGLIFEAMFAGLYVVNTMGQLGIYDAVAVTLIVAVPSLMAGLLVLCVAKPIEARTPTACGDLVRRP